jgi:pectate lyase
MSGDSLKVVERREFLVRVAKGAMAAPLLASAAEGMAAQGAPAALATGATAKSAAGAPGVARRQNAGSAAASAKGTGGAQRRPVMPAWPKAVVTLNVRDFGATGDGQTKDTAAIQQAIDRCAVLGGGNVTVPAGQYSTGAIALRSGVLLRLEQDATLVGTPDFADYPVTQVRWEGKWISGHIGFVSAIDAEFCGVVGPGKIVGNVALGGRPNAQNPLRHPCVVEFIRCRNVRLEDFSATNRLMWTIHPTYCDNVSIRNVSVDSTGGNGDGVDADSCRHVIIEGCTFSTGDDCISLKSGRGEEAYTMMRTTEDVLISGCTFTDANFACIGIGSEASGGIRDARIEKCKFIGAKSHAIYIKSRVGRGGFFEDIVVDDAEVSGMKAGFLRIDVLATGIQDQDPVPGVEGIPSLKNLRFTNVRVSDVPVLVEATHIDPLKPMDGFSLVNVTGTCAKGISIANAKNVEIRNVKVSGYDGPLLSVANVTGVGLAGATKIDAPKVPEPIAKPEKPYELR